MRRDVQKHLKKKLAKNPACYVLITCDKPSANGEMHVEMTYEGDATVAAYLLQGAQDFMDEQNEEPHCAIASCCKVHQL